MIIYFWELVRISLGYFININNKFASNRVIFKTSKLMFFRWLLKLMFVTGINKIGVFIIHSIFKTRGSPNDSNYSYFRFEILDFIWSLVLFLNWCHVKMEFILLIWFFLLSLIWWAWCLKLVLGGAGILIFFYSLRISLIFEVLEETFKVSQEILRNQGKCWENLWIVLEIEISWKIPVKS